MAGARLGIDLGTSKVAIYLEGEGVVLREPAVIAVGREDDRLICGGQEALEMIGREPPSIKVVMPLEHGTISDYDYAERMIKLFVRRVCSYKLIKPRAAVSVPTSVTEVETRSVMQAITAAGIRQAILIEEHVAAAIGAGMDIAQPRASMVVDFGAGTTDIAILSVGGIAAESSIRSGGLDLDDILVRMMRTEYGLVVGKQTAERVKKSIGYATDAPKELTMNVPGRDAVSGLPVVRAVSADSVCKAIDETLTDWEMAIHDVLESCPPDLVGDIYTDGIVLTGGGALLKNLDKRLTNYIGTPCRVADAPADCVAIGTGIALRRAKGNSAYHVNEFEYDFAEWSNEI